MRTWLSCVIAGALLLPLHRPVLAQADGTAAARRISDDIAAGKPIVVHVVVALCDNRNQGIVPVPPKIGNGQDAANNLYWGAAYGVRTFLSRRDVGWHLLADLDNGRPEILDRILLCDTIGRDSISVPVFLIAEAWDGKEMKGTVQRFFTLAAGREPEVIEPPRWPGIRIPAGGLAHLVIFVGHNGLMDYIPPGTAAADSSAPPRSAVVLACASDFYFRKRLTTAGAHPLLLTSGLMAPEAYTLDALVRTWASGKGGSEVADSAASAYHRYQKCGMKAARRLFTTGP